MRSLVSDRPISFFDLETTGTGPDARIVQIAIRTSHPPSGRWSEFESLVNPEIPIPPEATAVHEISDADVKSAPTLITIADRIHAEMTGDLCGFNALKFDIPVLARELERVGTPLDMTGRRIIDPYRIYMQREPRTLEAAVRFYCSRKHDGAHDAMTDVQATIDVLGGQLQRYTDLPLDVQSLHDTCMDPRAVDLQGRLTRDDEGRICLAFGKHKGTPVAEADPDYLRWMLKTDFPADTKAILRSEAGL